MFNTGYDFFTDLRLNYGLEEAKKIADRYLDTQLFNEDAQEVQFCKELYSARTESVAYYNHLTA